MADRAWLRHQVIGLHKGGLSSSRASLCFHHLCYWPLYCVDMKHFVARCMDTDRCMSLVSVIPFRRMLPSEMGRDASAKKVDEELDEECRFHTGHSPSPEVHWRSARISQ
jgi:hypothetical protein